jgi:2-(1,2-epoxy-1,2-dihydrophenyl)acetyl-CoA isomerase
VSATIEVRVADGVAELVFNRPAVLNALDAEMICAFRRHCETLADDASVRCLVLRGSGAAFVAGGDVAYFHRHLDELPALVRRLAGELHCGVTALRRMPKPVLGSVHGAVAGAGVSLMAACDLVIAADDCRFSLAYSRIGASPDGGATYFLARSLGPRRAMELALLSEPVDAATALRIGLVNRVVSAAALREETQALAARLASGPTVAFAETKRLLEASQQNSLQQQLDAEAEAFARCAATDDMREGVSAFVEKRRPGFKGR